MIAPSIAANDAERVAALRTYDILDTPEEEIFDQITTAASRVCRMPISLLTLVDKNRQWFKSTHGLAMRESDRQISFCAHAIHENEVFAIEDAYIDERTAGNPLVMGYPHLRSYAGKPLFTPEGHALGTLCVLDTVPRKLTNEQTAALERLAESAMRLIRLRAKNKGAVFAKAVDAVNDGIAIADVTVEGWSLVYANKSFLAMTGFEYHEVIGQPFTFPLAPEDAVPFEESRRAAETSTGECIVSGHSGRRFWDRVSFIPYIDEMDMPLCAVMLHRDVSAEKVLELERQATQAMRTTIKSVKHIVLNFMNAVELYRSEMDAGRAPNAEMRQALNAAMESTRDRLITVETMPVYKERATPFGFSLLDTDGK